LILRIWSQCVKNKSFTREFERLNSISDDLLSTWKVLTAFKKTEQSSDYDREIFSKLVDALGHIDVAVGQG